MAERHWCDYCQEWSDESHFGPDDLHLVGNQYGQQGALLAENKRLKEALERLATVQEGDWEPLIEWVRATARAARDKGEPKVRCPHCHGWIPE